MSTVGLWLLSVGVATLTASASSELRHRWSRRVRARNAAFRVPRTRIEQAKTGETVRVVGRINLLPDSLRAPFSGRPCAHYEAGVEIPKRGGGFLRAHTDTKSTAFVLDDGSGRALVRVDHSLIEVILDHYWSAHELDPETRFELEQSLFAAGSRGPALLRAGHSLRYAEGALEEGELCHVVGAARWVEANEAGLTYRDGGKRLLIEAGAGRVFVTDRGEDAAL